MMTPRPPHSSVPTAPLPEPLREALRTHPDRVALERLWALLGEASALAGDAGAELAWERIAAATTGDADAVVRHPRVIPMAPAALRRQRRWSPAVLAAAASVVLVVGATLWQSTPVRERAPAGEHRTVTLPDGSRVELNAGSEVRYARGFRTPVFTTASTRALTLDGEAFFDVQPSHRPFEVVTKTARVTVVGTSFVVRAHATDRTGTDVAVKSGRVRVEAAKKGTEFRTLSAGEAATVADGRVMSVSLDAGGVDRRTMWRRGGIALVDQPLDAIFRELERQYAVDIRLVDVVVGQERLTLYYPERPSLETVLDDLCTRGGLRYRRTSRGYEIMPAAESIAPTR